MRIILVILHKLILMAFGIYWLGEYFLTLLRGFLNTCGNRQDLRSDKIYIERHIRNLDRVPLHIALLMGVEENPNLSILAHFIIWVAAAGIHHVTIYSHKGDKNMHKIRDFVLHHLKYLFLYI